MTHIQNKIVNYLKTYCYGKEHAISKDRLARYFNITTRELRDIKRDIVINERVPIGSNRNGYFYAKDLDEIELFIGEYKSRVGEHMKMVNAYTNMIGNNTQLNFF